MITYELSSYPDDMDLLNTISMSFGQLISPYITKKVIENYKILQLITCSWGLIDGISPHPKTLCPLLTPLCELALAEGSKFKIHRFVDVFGMQKSCGSPFRTTHLTPRLYFVFPNPHASRLPHGLFWCEATLPFTRAPLPKQLQGTAMGSIYK